MQNNGISSYITNIDSFKHAIKSFSINQFKPIFGVNLESGGAFNNMSTRRSTEFTPPERERSPARQRALATQADGCVALYI